MQGRSCGEQLWFCTKNESLWCRQCGRSDGRRTRLSGTSAPAARRCFITGWFLCAYRGGPRLPPVLIKDTRGFRAGTRLPPVFVPSRTRWPLWLLPQLVPPCFLHPPSPSAPGTVLSSPVAKSQPALKAEHAQPWGDAWGDVPGEPPAPQAEAGEPGGVGAGSGEVGGGAGGDVAAAASQAPSGWVALGCSCAQVGM